MLPTLIHSIVYTLLWHFSKFAAVSLPRYDNIIMYTARTLKIRDRNQWRLQQTRLYCNLYTYTAAAETHNYRVV